MNWKLSIPLTGILAVSLTLFVFRRDPSVPSGLFQSRLRDTLLENGFVIVAQASGNRDQVPLPRTIQWHSRRWCMERSSQAVLGFPDSSDHFTVTSDGSSMIECFVRYLDARAQLVEIRVDPSHTIAASALRTTLIEEFPGLPIRVRTE